MTQPAGRPPAGHFISVDHRTVYPLSEPRWCDDQGGLLDIVFEPRLDIARIGHRPPTLWRYREALPFIPDEDIVSFDEGMTPLLTIPILGKPVRFKADFMFPSGSYKDRGSTVLISYLRSLRIPKVVQDSSGNAAASIAQYCARAGISCEIFVPAYTSSSKVHQIAASGSIVTMVADGRQAAADAARRAAERSFYASHVWHPMYFHGTKTFAYEVCEQMSWKAPDTIVLPVSNGALLLGVYIGLVELFGAGVIEKLPRLVGVQTQACAPVYNAFEGGRADVEAVEPQPTIAEGIAATNPKRGRQLLECLYRTNGMCLRVSENEIKAALAQMCLKGFFIEPTAAATVAGVRQYMEHHAVENEVVVSVLSGSGLKAADKVAEIVNSTPSNLA